MHRLFVAIDLPDTVRDAARRLQSGLPGARWIGRDNLHITLRFIGEVDGGLLEDVVSALAAVEAEPFDLTLEGLDTFGNRRNAHQLWVGIAKSAPLLRLKNRVDAALARLGLAADDRKFAPHVTLARVKAVDRSRLGGYLAANNLFRSPAFAVDSFVLFSSVLRPEGPIYTAEAVYPLGTG